MRGLSRPPWRAGRCPIGLVQPIGSRPGGPRNAASKRRARSVHRQSLAEALQYDVAQTFAAHQTAKDVLHGSAMPFAPRGQGSGFKASSPVQQPAAVGATANLAARAVFVELR